MARYRVTGALDYVQGHLRYGHFELEVDKEEWDKLSQEEQKERLKDYGELIIDDWEIDGTGDIYEITKEEI